MLLAVAGALTYAVANNAAGPPYHPPVEPSISPPTAAAPAPQVVVAVPVSQAADQPARSGASGQSKMPHSTIAIESTPVIVPPDKSIPLLGPVVREKGYSAAAIPPFLLCTVEILERGAIVSRQSIGCTQADEGERPAMLMEFGQEVPNELPNMQYWISVQVDGYRGGYPILRTRMELKGLLGRATGRRKYESVTVVEPNKKHTVMAFTVDDDEFEVKIAARKQN